MIGEQSHVINHVTFEFKFRMWKARRALQYFILRSYRNYGEFSGVIALIALRRILLAYSKTLRYLGAET